MKVSDKSGVMITPRIAGPEGPSINVYYMVGGAFLFAILLVIPLFKNNYITYVVTQMLLFAYLGLAWNIMCGYTGQLSFGHATFFGIGAYASSLLYLKLGLTPWIGMLLGGCLAFGVGAGLGYVSFRYGLRGVFFALITLTTSEMFRLLTLFWNSLTNGAEGILLPWKGHNLLMFSFETHKKYLYYYTILGMMIVCLVIAYWIKRIRFGYYLAAIRENEDAAETLGINGPMYKIVAIGISAFLTAMGGTFYAQYYQHFEPDDVFGPMRSFEIIFPVILGGGGNVMGPGIGAVVLQFFEEMTRAFMPSTLHGFDRMLYGILIVVMIMYLPTGIVTFIEKWRDRLASKYRIRTED